MNDDGNTKQNRRRFRLLRKRPVQVLLGLLILFLLWWGTKQPSNDRDWSPDQAILPFARFDGESVTVQNVRRCLYRASDDYDVTYSDRRFDLDALATVDFAVEPISDLGGAAHTFLTFGFDDGARLAISVEIRKEKQESFSAFWGMLREYEIMYVIADERDPILLRTLHRQNDVYLYPIRSSREKMRTLFVGMLERANALFDRPEFYHTVTNTCTTNILVHLNEVAEQKVPWNLQVLFPAHSGRLAYDLGLIDTRLSFEQAREFFRINGRAEQFADSDDFSLKIREHE